MIHDRIKPHDSEPPTEQELDDEMSEAGLFSLVRPTEEEDFGDETPPAQDIATQRDRPRSTMKKRKLNVRLLRRIQKHILEEPRRFFMEGIILEAANQKEWKEKAGWYADAASTMPSCKTAACIAGWAVLLEKRKLDGDEAMDVAQSLLRLTSEQRSRLFLDAKWPEPFDEQYQTAKTPKQRANIACARIDYLIKTGE